LNETKLPHSFYKYFYEDRIEIIRRICREGFTNNILIEMTRALPVVVTYGSEGLSGSVKMVGFVPRTGVLMNYVEKAEYLAYKYEFRDTKEIFCKLLENIYILEDIDVSAIGGLEMGFKHSWRNIMETGKATLVFFTPPSTSFEVRCVVEIHDEKNDPYKRYLNALHDIFHARKGVRSDYPAYIFRIEEIYDNSSRTGGFGEKIYP